MAQLPSALQSFSTLIYALRISVFGAIQPHFSKLLHILLHRHQSMTAAAVCNLKFAFMFVPTTAAQ
jgi:hypothetical protein